MTVLFPVHRRCRTTDYGERACPDTQSLSTMNLLMQWRSAKHPVKPPGAVTSLEFGDGVVVNDAAIARVIPYRLSGSGRIWRSSALFRLTGLAHRESVIACNIPSGILPSAMEVDRPVYGGITLDGRQSYRSFSRSAATDQVRRTAVAREASDSRAVDERDHRVLHRFRRSRLDPGD